MMCTLEMNIPQNVRYFPNEEKSQQYFLPYQEQSVQEVLW